MREPAKTPAAALDRYLRILQLALSCLTDEAWLFSGKKDGELIRLVTDTRSIPLKRNKGPVALELEPSQAFRVIPDERFKGEYKVKTLAYIYSVRVAARRGKNRRDLVLWHWHPDRTPERSSPHIHVAADHRSSGAVIAKLHIPTGRVAFEEVVRFLVDELKVIPARTDWREVIGDCEARFRKYRTWS